MKKAFTDPQKIYKGDPGRPDICLVFTYHKKFNPDEVQEIRKGCESGQLGCVECKSKCAEKIIEFLKPIHEKRAHFESNLKEVKQILLSGEERAREVAHKTMQDVHEAMKLG